MKSILAALILIMAASTVVAQRQVEVVAEVGLTGQVNTILNRVLHTPSQTGMYRATFYLQCTKGDPQGQGMIAALNWHDDVGPESYQAVGICYKGATTPASFSIVIKGLQGSPIEWSVGKEAYGDKSVYEVYLSLEHIGSMVQ